MFICNIISSIVESVKCPIKIWYYVFGDIMNTIYLEIIFDSMINNIDESLLEINLKSKIE